MHQILKFFCQDIIYQNTVKMILDWFKEYVLTPKLVTDYLSLTYITGHNIDGNPKTRIN